jgi:excisionase family DNA binding protein
VTLENSSPEGSINPFLTAEEVAQYLRLPLSTVYRLAQTAVIPSFKIGKHWRFRRDTIEKWIIQQENRQGDQ